jgi:hypothetical protein
MSVQHDYMTCTFCDRHAITAHVRDSRPVDYYCHVCITTGQIPGRAVGHWLTPTFTEVQGD